MPSAPDGVMLDGAGGVAGGTTDSGTRGAGVGAGLALGVLVGVVERTAVGSDGVLVDVIVAVGVDVVVTVGEGATLNHASIQRNPENATWRVAFTIRPGETVRPVELRCFIRGEDGAALTETWSHLWSR